jgi:DNA-directed RNA polymerase subunit E'/Rpb7
MFQTAVIKHNIKLQAREVGTNVREVVESRARALLEGVCGENGFIRPNSLSLVIMSRGVLGDIDMGKSYSFEAIFKAEVCNPVRGMRFNALVRSINRFGLLCEGGYYDHDNTMVPVIEVVVVRNPTTVPNETDITNVDVGDEVGVEVLGRNFDLRDSRISAFGRTVADVDTPAIYSEVAADAESDNQAGDETAENDDTEESSDGEESGSEDADDVMKEDITGDVDTNALPGVDIDDEGFSLVEEENDDVPDIDSELEEDD